METDCFIHNLHSTTSHISSGFSRNSEAFASEFQENHDTTDIVMFQQHDSMLPGVKGTTHYGTSLYSTYLHSYKQSE